MFYLILVLSPAVLLPIIYWYYIVYVKFKSFRNLPGPKPIPVIGTLISSDGIGIIKQMQELHRQYKPRFVIYTGPQVRVVHTDPAHVQYVLNTYTHTTKSDNFRVLMKWIGEGLGTCNGNKWRTIRKFLNQSFNMSNEKFIRVFNRATNIFVKNLRQEVDKDRVDIMQYCTLTTLDSVCESLMGVNLKLQENENQDYIHQTKIVFQIVGIRFFSWWAKYETLFLLFSKQKEIYKKCIAGLHEFTLNLIKDRSRTYKDDMGVAATKNDFGIKQKFSLMDSLLEENENGNMTFEEVRQEIDTFVVAGHETTAGHIAFALLCLAEHPETQKILYEEIMSVLPSGDFTSDQLNSMTYLDCVVKETLRVFPTVPFMERVIEQEFELDGITYPVGTLFTIPIICMHTDPDVFPNPERFDPTRFLPENADKIPKNSFIPFSSGPRICIGYKYARLSAKCAIAKCIREYELLPVPGFKPEVEFQISLKSSNGVFVRLKNRKKGL